MNPDNYNNKTAESITWTLKDSNGNVVTFKVSPGTVLIQDGDEWHEVDKEKGRRVWKEYIDKGFRVQNKCINHDMKKFHDAKRKEENKERNKKVMSNIADSMDEYMKKIHDKKIHDNDLQEMRINPKKLYTDNWDNYALEA